jgi:hypothetical protein
MKHPNWVSTKPAAGQTFKSVLIIAIAFSTIPLVASAEDAKQDFALTNKTGYELKELYVSPRKGSDGKTTCLGKRH